jgi:DNA modification methylase
MEHYNFWDKENWRNMVTANIVSKKLLHSSDKKPIKFYQKPRQLIDWMVRHWSWPGEWVLDLFSGSGTGLASCMAYGRHCVAMEDDPRQAMVLKERVLQLDEEDPNLKTAKLIGYETLDMDVAGGSQSQVGSQSLDAGISGTTEDDTVVE